MTPVTTLYYTLPAMKYTVTTTTRLHYKANGFAIITPQDADEILQIDFPPSWNRPDAPLCIVEEIEAKDFEAESDASGSYFVVCFITTSTFENVGSARDLQKIMKAGWLTFPDCFEDEGSETRSWELHLDSSINEITSCQETA